MRTRLPHFTLKLNKNPRNDDIHEFYVSILKSTVSTSKEITCLHNEVYLVNAV